ncbi:MAG: sugar kinase [Clostridia bacterium]|nr:sugar kinase [Clostridia bacterium]
MGAVVIGSVFVDVKGFASGHYVPEGRNIGTIEFMHGGVCRNVCEDFGSQGMPVSFVTMIEDTGLGLDVRNRLEQRGVDVTHMISAPGGMGMWLAILDENGDLAGSISRQPSYEALGAYIEAHGDEIVRDADVIILEIDIGAALADRILTLAEKYKKDVYAIVANMEVILQHREFLSRIRCFICNSIEAGRLLGVDLTPLPAFEMLEALRLCVDRFHIPAMVITMGESGAVYYDVPTNDGGHCPAIPTEMVDSTGAGDAFLAGTVMGLMKELPLWHAVRVGTRLASATLRSPEASCRPIPGLFD